MLPVTVSLSEETPSERKRCAYVSFCTQSRSNNENSVLEKEGTRRKRLVERSEIFPLIRKREVFPFFASFSQLNQMSPSTKMRLIGLRCLRNLRTVQGKSKGRKKCASASGIDFLASAWPVSVVEERTMRT